MPEDINELDVTDADIKAIFSKRNQDKTLSDTRVVISKKESPTPAPAKAVQKVMEEPVKVNTWMDNLKACAIWAFGFGCLTVLFFSWQQKGLMDASVAVPTMLTCAALGGWGVGKNAMRGK